MGIMANKRFFTEEHEWIEVLEANRIRIGITDHAQDEMGDVVFVELPFEDDEFEAGEDFAMVESVKSTSEIFIPAAGRVVAVNEQLEDEPELVNDSPEDEGWIAEFELEEDFDGSDLMDRAAYDEYLDTL
jgi:glycine cleavage system H protein